MTTVVKMEFNSTPNLTEKVDVEVKRGEILKAFQEIWALHASLYECVKDEFMPVKSINLRHPLIFYTCHTAAFYINKLYLGKFLKERIDPELEFMVAVGVDEMSWDDVNDQHYDWPSVERAREFRSKVYECVTNFIKNTPLELPVEWNSPFWPVIMGIEHENIHIETSSVLIRQHKLDRLIPTHPYWGTITEGDREAPTNELVPIEGGITKLGKFHRSPDTYGWDNEYGQREDKVEAFKASKYLVSNREWLAFQQAGGYTTQRWWTDEGWKFVTQMKRTKPEFWVVDESAPEGFAYRSLLKIIPMPWSWPVDVNYLESKAFCNWKTECLSKPIRLPSEAEWYRMLDHAQVMDLPEWRKAGKAAPSNLNLESGPSSCPVDKFQHGDLYDVTGNVWQWTETQFDAIDDTFRFHPLYHDFSLPTFDTQHNIMKGGSFISRGNEANQCSRYAFRRHFYQHAGFRYVETEYDVPQTANRLVNHVTTNPFENERVAMQYIEFHYAESAFGVANFPKRCAEICGEVAKGLSCNDKALDLGCAAGRATFELTRHFTKVAGVDKSARMIWSALDMQQLERILWTICEESNLFKSRNASLSDLGLSDDCFVRLQFKEATAEDLPAEYTDYDLIHAGLLLEYLSNPREFLKGIKPRVKVGGALVLTSTYNWSEEFTPREEWLGGFVNAESVNVYTYPSLKAEMLENGWEEIREPEDLEFVFRKSNRVYDHNVAQITAWKRVN